jgi:hypothetical protein
MTKSDGSVLFFSGVACIASCDILLRTLPELLGLGDSFVLPILTIVTFRHVVQFATVGWGLGWLLLFSLVYYFTPKLYPETILRWASGVQVRFALALSAVGVGLLVEKAILVTMGFGTTPTPLSPRLVVGVLAGVVALFTLASVTDPIVVRTRFFSVPDSSLVQLPERLRRDYSFAEFTIRGSLLAVVLGVLLAEVSLLYPLPELLVLGVVAYEGLFDGLLDGNYLPARRDAAERAAFGAVSAWGRPRHLVVLLYAVFVIFMTILFALFAFDHLPLLSMIQRNPGSVLLILSMIGTTLLYTTKYSLRILVRLPLQVHESLHTGSVPDGPEFERVSHRIPGFLLPSVILFFTFSRLFITNTTIEAVPLSELSTAQVALAVGLVLTVLLLSYRPFPEPVDLSDYHALPAAVGLGLCALFFLDPLWELTFALWSGTAVDVSVQSSRTLIIGPFAVFLALCPYLIVTGFNYWQRDPNYDPTDNTRTLAMSWGVFATCFCLLLVVGGVSQVLGVSTDSIPDAVLFVITVPLLVSAPVAALTSLWFLYRASKRVLELLLSILVAVVLAPVWILKMASEWLAGRSVVEKLREK